MRIFINASNLHMAGGLSVGLGIIKGIINNQENYEYIIYIPNKKLYPFEAINNIVFIEKPSWMKNSLSSIFSSLYEKHLLKKYKPEKIFTLGNIPMVTKIPQLLMIQWAYLVYPDSIVWNRMGLKEKLIRKFKIYRIKSRLKYISAISVQTEVMKERMLKYLNIHVPIFVVPSTFAPINIQDNSKNSIILPETFSLKLLCLSHYYSHKNLELLIDTAYYAKRDGTNLKFVLTLNPKQKEVEKYFKEIEHRGLSDYFINLGPVTIEQLPSIYNYADAFILPTLLETVGLTFYEAMYFKKLIFASDLDFARGVCKNAAIYINPFDAKEVHDKIKSYSNNQNDELIREKISIGTQLVSSNSDWDSSSTSYIAIIKTLK